MAMSATFTVVVRAGSLHAVVEHDVAERAGGGDAAGAGADRLDGPLVVHLRADVLLHPHARADRRRSTCPWCRCAASRRSRCP